MALARAGEPPTRRRPIARSNALAGRSIPPWSAKLAVLIWSADASFKLSGTRAHEPCGRKPGARAQRSTMQTVL